MKIRIQTLWKLPVYYFIASWLSFYAIVLAGPLFTIMTPDEAGGYVVSVDPMRSFLVNAVIFAAVFLIGGRWLCRSMTRLEVAVSAGLLSVAFLVLTICELTVPGWFSPIVLIYLETVNGIVASALFQLTDQLAPAALMSAFTPMLFVLFGKKTIAEDPEKPSNAKTA